MSEEEDNTEVYDEDRLRKRMKLPFIFSQPEPQNSLDERLAKWYEEGRGIEKLEKILGIRNTEEIMSEMLGIGAEDNEDSLRRKMRMPWRGEQQP
jgi:endonuclease V-like protein UPF0215 family